jgi:hypothetical protein
MLNCKRATEMVLKKQSVKLSLMERLNLFIHLSMCRFCSLFEKQNALIDAGVQKLDDIQLENLSEASKLRIVEKIQH